MHKIIQIVKSFKNYIFANSHRATTTIVILFALIYYITSHNIVTVIDKVVHLLLYLIGCVFLVVIELLILAICYICWNDKDFPKLDDTIFETMYVTNLAFCTILLFLGVITL